jgi:hypothetical protein
MTSQKPACRGIFMVLRGPYGVVFVKSLWQFARDRGFQRPWGEQWVPIVTTDEETARKLALDHPHAVELAELAVFRSMPEFRDGSEVHYADTDGAGDAGLMTQLDVYRYFSKFAVAPSYIESSVKFRGSVTDLVTDLSALLTVEQLQELAGEAAVEWRRRRAGQSKSYSFRHQPGCAAQPGGFGACDCTGFEEPEG